MGARLELTWPNKEKFLLSPSDEAGKPVWVARSHPAAHEVRLTDFTGEFGEVNSADPYADNLLFTGDSLDVLRVLARVPEYARHYRGRVRLAYLDPPFNTGGAFEHYDDWLDHSTWLSFMRERLVLLRELLRNDGTVWVHLDNYEVHRMRCLMDEVLGADAFINQVVWQRTQGKSAARRGMGTMADTLLVYGRTAESSLNKVYVPLSEKHLATEYRHSDERGRYMLGDVSAPGLRSGDSGQPWRGRLPPGRNRHWSVPTVEGITDGANAALSTQERLDLLFDAGYIHLPEGEGSAPKFKRYLSQALGTAIGDLWTDVPRVANSSVERLGYDTQKPEALLERVLSMSTQAGDIVLDGFVGSGTTAAVAQKMGRRWVAVELSPDNTDKFTRPRLERTVTGEDQGGISKSVGWEGGGGFRTVRVAPSAYAETPFGTMLDDWATEGDTFARLMAGQLGFDYAPEGPFAGRRGRMRLFASAGAVGVEEAAVALSALDASERVTMVATVLLDGVEEFVREQSRGSRVLKAPRDVLRPRRVRKGVES